jgi:hypothetical protein
MICEETQGCSSGLVDGAGPVSLFQLQAGSCWYGPGAALGSGTSDGRGITNTVVYPYNDNTCGYGTGTGWGSGDYCGFGLGAPRRPS